jgi:hypothetical protein
MNSERTAFWVFVTVALVAALFITPATAGEVTANSTGTLADDGNLTEPTLTFGPVVSATAVQYAGLPSSWLAGLVALAGATLLVRMRKRG